MCIGPNGSTPVGGRDAIGMQPGRDGWDGGCSDGKSPEVTGCYRMLPDVDGMNGWAVASRGLRSASIARRLPAAARAACAF